MWSVICEGVARNKGAEALDGRKDRPGWSQGWAGRFACVATLSRSAPAVLHCKPTHVLAAPSRYPSSDWAYWLCSQTDQSFNFGSTTYWCATLGTFLNLPELISSLPGRILEIVRIMYNISSIFQILHKSSNHPFGLPTRWGGECWDRGCSMGTQWRASTSESPGFTRQRHPFLASHSAGMNEIMNIRCSMWA